MIDWVLEELRYKSTKFKKTGAVSVYNGDVVKSDSSISTSVKAAFQNEVAALDNAPDFCKDNSPDSDDNVVNLVHPSLFPLVYREAEFLGAAL